MKKSFKNFVILTLAVSIIAATLIMFLENLLGVANVFMAAVIITLIASFAVSVRQLVKKEDTPW